MQRSRYTTAVKTPPSVPQPVLSEAELSNQITENRLRYLETMIARVANELGIRLGPHDVERPFPTIKQCIAAVGAHYGMGVHEILSNSRKAANAGVRQTAMYLAKTLTRHSYSDIGRVFDRDHTTVLHSVRKIEMNRKADAMLDKDIADISREILAKNAPPGASGGLSVSDPPRAEGPPISSSAARAATA